MPKSDRQTDVAPANRSTHADRTRIPSFPTLPDLPAELECLVRQIPTGRVTTYGRLAAALGSRLASRWVGHYLLHHQHQHSCPCHRVVRATGQLGGFVGRRPDQKAILLRSENVESDGGKLDLDRYLFDTFDASHPLQTLARYQTELICGYRQETLSDWQRVGAVDVSYQRDRGFAAYVEMQAEGQQGTEICFSQTVQLPVTFPYISSFLAFRELPLLLRLLKTVARERQIADVLLVDGSGIAHPRQAGIATMLGLITGQRTVGVTKKLLHGQTKSPKVKRPEPIEAEGRKLGYAVLPTRSTQKPIYVSPGYRTDVEGSLALVNTFLWGHRLPEPIYWADRLSREASR